MNANVSLRYIQTRLNPFVKDLNKCIGKKLKIIFFNNQHQMSPLDIFDRITETVNTVLAEHPHNTTLNEATLKLGAFSKNIFLKYSKDSEDNFTIDQYLHIHNIKSLINQVKITQKEIKQEALEKNEEFAPLDEETEETLVLAERAFINCIMKYTQTAYAFINLLKHIREGIYGEEMKQGFLSGVDTLLLQSSYFMRLLCIDYVRSGGNLLDLDCFKTYLKSYERGYLIHIQNTIKKIDSSINALSLLGSTHKDSIEFNYITSLMRLNSEHYYGLTLLMQVFLHPHSLHPQNDINTKIMFLCYSGHLDIAFDLLLNDDPLDPAHILNLNHMVSIAFDVDPLFIFNNFHRIPEGLKKDVCLTSSIDLLRRGIHLDKIPKLMKLSCNTICDELMHKSCMGVINDDSLEKAMLYCFLIEDKNRQKLVFGLINKKFQSRIYFTNDDIIFSYLRIALRFNLSTYGMEYANIILDHILEEEEVNIRASKLHEFFEIVLENNLNFGIDFFAKLKEVNDLKLVLNRVIPTIFRLNNQIAINLCKKYDFNLLVKIFLLLMEEDDLPSLLYIINTTLDNPVDRYQYLKWCYSSVKDNKKFLTLIKQEYIKTPTQLYFAFLIDHVDLQTLVNQLEKKNLKLYLFEVCRDITPQNYDFKQELLEKYVKLFNLFKLNKIPESLNPYIKVQTLIFDFLEINKSLTFVQKKLVFPFYISLLRLLASFKRNIESRNFILQIMSSVESNNEDQYLSQNWGNNPFLENYYFEIKELHLLRRTYLSLPTLNFYSEIETGQIISFIDEICISFPLIRKGLLKTFSEYFCKRDNYTIFCNHFPNVNDQIVIRLESFKMLDSKEYTIDKFNRLWSTIDLLDPHYKVSLEEGRALYRAFLPSKSTPKVFVNALNELQSSKLKVIIFLHRVFFTNSKLQFLYMNELNNLRDVQARKEIEELISKSFHEKDGIN